MRPKKISQKKSRSPSSPQTMQATDAASSTETLHRQVAELQAKIHDLELENKILREALPIENQRSTEQNIDSAFAIPFDTVLSNADASQADWQSESQSLTIPLQNPDALACLYEIDRIASDPRRSLEEILQSVVSALPAIWPNQKIGAAGIIFQNRQFVSNRLADCHPNMHIDLFVSRRKIGSLFLYENSATTSPSSQKASVECLLIKAVGEKIGSILSYHHQMGLRRRVEARFRMFFNTSPDAITISRLDDGLIIDVNDGFCTLTGHPRETVIGKSVHEIGLWITPSDRRQFVERLLREEQVRNFECKMHLKNGQEVVALISAALLDLDNQKHILSVSRDITSLKEAETERRQRKTEIERQYRILKETQAALVASREQYYHLYHTAPVGYFSLDRQGRVLAINKTGVGLLGLGRDDVRDRQFAEVVVPDDRPVLAAHLEQAFQEDERHTCEIRLLRKEGRPLFVRLESIVQTDGRTRNRICQTMMSDNTEMKKTENALKASYRFLKIANSHAQLEPTLKEFAAEIKALTGCRAVGVRMLDPAGHIPYRVIDGFCDGFHEKENHLSIHRDQCLCIRVIRNEVDPKLPYFTAAGSFHTNSTTRLLSTTNEKTIGQTRDTCHQFGYESVALIPVKAENQIIGLLHVADRRKDLFSEGIIGLLEKAALQLGNSIQRVNAVEALKKAKTRLEDHVAERTAALQSSIELLQKEFRERERVEKRLRDSKNMLQAVFDGISDPLILTDRQMTVLTINKAAMNYFHLQKRRSAIGKSCRDAFHQAPEYCDSCRIPEAVTAGRSISFERESVMNPGHQEQVIVYPIFQTDPSPGQAVIRINDITESRIVERQLIQNEKMASLGMLISSIAHELNNPNSFIAFNIPILKDYFKEILPIVDHYAGAHPEFEVANMPYMAFREDTFRLFENLEHGSVRISTFLANLKEFAQSKPETIKTHSDVRRIVKHSLAICRTKVQKTVKRLIVSMPERDSAIFTNPVALEQILINLLVNAAQASDKEDSWIRLTVEKREQSGGEWLFEIEDNGCGMDEKTRLQIFEPFFSTKLNEGGSGLGLYVCKRLVRDLGGSIHVDSRHGGGSTFSVILYDG